MYYLLGFSYFKDFTPSNPIFTPFYLLGKGGYVFGSVGLSVCLFVCL